MMHPGWRRDWKNSWPMRRFGCVWPRQPGFWWKPILTPIATRRGCGRFSPMDRQSSQARRQAEMRIAYVCADRGVPIFGNKGCSIHVREVISALLRRGARIDLFASQLDGQLPGTWQNVRIHTLPLLSSTDPCEREQMSLACNEHTMAALRKSGPFDMVYERYSLWSYAA